MNKNRKFIFGGAALLLLLILGFMLVGQTDDYPAGVLDWRRKKDALFKTERSPLTPEGRGAFRGLDYYEPDINYRFDAVFIRENGGMEMNAMEPSDRPRKFGVVAFEYQGKNYRLTAYKQAPDTDRELFVPFKDPTNGAQTYGGGRYLNLTIKDGGALVLDFNYAYNPYCAYNATYTCPLPPPENALPFSVPVGEKNWQKGA